MATSTLTPARSGLSSIMVRYAWGVVAYTVLVILWGALVRATGSGAGCGNHWPLCNGQVVPIAPTLHTIIEFTHRMMVGGSTLAVLGLLVGTFRFTHKGQAARPAAVVSTLLLVNEAFLGALLVKLGYVTDNQSIGRVVLLAVHLSNTLLLLAALTASACFLATRETSLQALATARSNLFGLLALLATLAVGVSGSLAALGDTLFPAASLQAAFAQDIAANSPWLLRIRWVHPASALLATGLILILLLRSGLTRVAKTVIALCAFQFLFGMLDILLLAPTWLQLVHLLGADLFWVALTVLVLNRRPTQTAPLA